ncbi:MAG: hypothetical protein A2W03_07825 [Candidatus Aminicenantes bacterium RBG_16_63_16]|nr:MAG: hypothetical protein A2W03_07825 [Candidatus Aminicenantes bacterium RBG_16_63_16]
MKKPAVGLILAACLAVAAAAQEKIEDLAKSAPSRAKYPDSSAVVVRAGEVFTLLKTGGATHEYFRALEVFNLTGREKFSDFRIPFDRNNEKVEVVLAKTIKGDGTVIDVEPKAINDVTPPELAEADLYANVLHRVLSFSAVDPGAMLAVHYKKSDEKAGQVEGVVLLQFDEPIVRKDLKIVIPGDRTLRRKVRGLAAGFSEEAGEEGRKTYHLQAADSPQIKPEEYMPPLQEIASRAVFSTYPDWRAASGGFAGSFTAASDPGPDIVELAGNLTKGAATELDRIKAVFFFVARDIRSVRFAFGEGGYDVHPASTVLKNRYGDWKDKGALLVALLKAAGLTAHPVLVNARSVPPEEDVPTLKQFDALLVAVPRAGNGGRLFLNPFADDSLFGYFRDGRGSRGLLVRPDGAEFVDVRCLPEAESVESCEISAELDSSGAVKGKISAALSGIFDLRGRQELKDMTARERDNFFAESVNRLCEDGRAMKNELSDAADLAKPLRISQEFSGRNYGIFQGAIMLVPVPPVPYGFADLPSAPSLAKRRYPFRLTAESEIHSTVSFKIPPGFKPLYLPEGFSHAKDFGEFSFAASYDPEKSTVTIKKTLAFKKREIPLEQYDDFKKILDSFGITKNTLILLEKE